VIYRFIVSQRRPQRYRGISSALTHPKRIYLRSGNSPPNAIKGSKRSGSRAGAIPSSPSIPSPPHGKRSVFQVAKMDSSWRGIARDGLNVGNARFGFYPTSVCPSKRATRRHECTLKLRYVWGPWRNRAMAAFLWRYFARYGFNAFRLFTFRAGSALTTRATLLDSLVP